MADYHPLISKAVAGLDKNTGENRRVLYERARTALVNQLRGVDPPLDESDITRERLALEEAIRKVEADAAKRTREEEAPPPELRPPPLSNQGLRGFRETVAEAEGLGGAAQQANRSAREAFETVPGSQAGTGHGTSYFEPPATEPPPPVSEPELMDETPPPPPRSRPYELPEGSLPPPPYEEIDYTTRPARSWTGLIKIVVVLAIIAALGGVGYWQRHTIWSLVAGFRSSPTKQQQQATQQPSRPKIADRVGDSGSPQSATAPAAAVAQKVVLYDEDANNPQGSRFVGSAIWSGNSAAGVPGLGL